MKLLTTIIISFFASDAFSGVDSQPWVDDDYSSDSNSSGALVLLILIGIIIQTKASFADLFGAMIDLIKYLAKIYIPIFLFIATIICIALFAQEIGISKGLSGIIGLCLSVYIAFKILEKK